MYNIASTISCLTLQISRRRRLFILRCTLPSRWWHCCR